MEQKKHFNIFEEFQKWSKDLDIWERLVLLKLVEAGSVSEGDLDQIYNEFCLDKGLQETSGTRTSSEFMRSSIPQRPTQSKPLLLEEIKEVKGVNAIAEGQVLNIGPKLTVVYGPNGSGKSGYVRIMKAACFTRSPNVEIHGDVNIHPDKRPIPQASFKFNHGPEVIFTLGDVCEQLRDNFAVFDNSCVRVSTDEQNKFVVSPYGFDVFQKFIEIIVIVKNRLNKEIESKTPELTEFDLKDSSSEIAEILKNLSVKTDINRVEELGKYGKDEEKRGEKIKRELADLAGKEVASLISKRRILGKDLKEAVKKIETANQSLEKSGVEKIKSYLEESAKLKDKAEAVSVAQFGKEPVQPVGGDTWKALLEAAIRFNNEAFPGKPFPVEEKDARCILCQQILSSDAKDRLKRFFSFVRSDAEKKLKDHVESLKLIEREFTKIDLRFFDKETAVYRSLNEYNADVCAGVEKCLNELLNQRVKILRIIQQNRWEDCTDVDISVLTKCQEIRNELAKEIKKLRREDVSKKKEMLEKELEFLEEKKYLNKMLAKIQKAIENLKWIRKAKKARQLLSPQRVTLKQKALFKELVTKGYEQRFFGECEKLKIEASIKFNITASEAVTNRSIVVGEHSSDVSGPHPSEVLSEGEQTVVALADFLAEVDLVDYPLSLIFDDPVNSMDHLRKDWIAKRLVEEATKRQVIIFTHDILFTHYLAEFSQELTSKKVTFKDCTISVGSAEGKPGYIDRAVFPYSHHEKTAIQKTEKYLVEARKESGEKQLDKLKLGCGILRSAYEDFIQQGIFRNIVRRWRENIMATVLEEVFIHEETSKLVVEKYELLSRYMEGHSQSPEYKEKPLTPKLLENETTEFKRIVKSYNSAAGKYRDSLRKDKKDVFTT